MDHRQKSNSKNIINEDNKRKNENQIGAENILSVIDEGENLSIKIKKSFLEKSSSYDVNKVLMAAVSPIFINKNKSITTEKMKPFIKKNYQGKSFKHIAFFIEHMPHYTGGRYSMYLQALILSQFTKVDVITNMKPVFYDDFSDYYNDNFRLFISHDYNLSVSENNYDLVVGVPHLSGQYAHSYSKKWNIPLYMVIFESPNYVSEYRDGADSTEDFWSTYKMCMSDADKIIVPSFESRKWVMEWDKVFKQIPITVIYPCMNEVVAKKVKNTEYKSDGKKSVVFISRMATFKNPLNIIKAIPSDIDVHVIGKVWSESKPAINELGDNIHFHGSLNDEEKFKIIKESECLIFPTKFEGFGMPPMEAFYFNKPVITYKLPVLEEIYEDLPIYANLCDEQEFIQKLKEVIKNNGKNQEKCEDSPILEFSRIKKCAEKMLDVFEIPKVSAGVMVYNGEEYLKYAINSLYQNLWEVIIVEGAVEKYSTKPISTDGTYKIINELKKQDILGKIRIFNKFKSRKFWKDKIEKQNIIAKNVTGKYYLKLDDDEIWDIQTFHKIIDLFESDDELMIIKMPFLHFWLSFNMVAKSAGGKWETKHSRIWRWNKKYRHNHSFNYFELDGMKVEEMNFKTFKLTSNCPIYHFGYVKKLSYLLNKIYYYKNRNIEKFVQDTVSNWDGVKNTLTQPTQNVRSWAEEFVGELPDVLSDHPYKEIEDVRKL